MAGFTRNPQNPECRACCSGRHTEEEACETCPYVYAGEEANFILKIFHLTCSKQTDKNKISRWYFDPDRMLFAYETFDIEDKERAFHYVAMGLNIMNGEHEVLVDEDDMDALL